jgi:plastocyanin
MPTNHEPCGKEETTLIPKVAGPMAELRRRALLDHRDMHSATEMVLKALVAVYGAAALLLSACGSTTSTSASSPTASAPTASAAPTPSPSPVGVAGPNLGVATKTVQIPGFFFSPSDLSVAAGSIVQWTQAHYANTHNVSFRTADAYSLLSPNLLNGRVWQVKFTVPGVYPYVCSLHPTDMKGTITVTG